MAPRPQKSSHFTAGAQHDCTNRWLDPPRTHGKPVCLQCVQVSLAFTDCFPRLKFPHSSCWAAPLTEILQLSAPLVWSGPCQAQSEPMPALYSSSFSKVFLLCSPSLLVLVDSSRSHWNGGNWLLTGKKKKEITFNQLEISCLRKEDKRWPWNPHRAKLLQSH